MKSKLVVFSISKTEKNLINYLDWFAIGFIPLFPFLIIMFGFPGEKFKIIALNGYKASMGMDISICSVAGGYKNGCRIRVRHDVEAVLPPSYDPIKYFFLQLFQKLLISGFSRIVDNSSILGSR